VSLDLVCCKCRATGSYGTVDEARDAYWKLAIIADFDVCPGCRFPARHMWVNIKRSRDASH
jgi:hypothetical protein